MPFPLWSSPRPKLPAKRWSSSRRSICALLSRPSRALPKDAGPFFNLGLLRAEDPETGVSDVTIHRMCVQGPDRISVSISIGRHIGVFLEKAWALGRPLPASCSIGVDPAIYVATSFEAPTTPLGFDELTIAGGLRGRPVELVDCVTQPAKAIARAEIVLEGEFRVNDRADEDAITGLGWAMPEFPGYVGPAQTDLAIFTVTGITHRLNPILQILVGPGEEHVTLAGLPTETSIYRLVEDAIPGFLQNVYVSSAGGRQVPGHHADQEAPSQRRGDAAAGRPRRLHRVRRAQARDPGGRRCRHLRRQRRHVGHDHALSGRCRHHLHPRCARPFARSFRHSGVQPVAQGPGITCKTIFDCTVPWGVKERFERSQFLDVDLEKYFS